MAKPIVQQEFFNNSLQKINGIPCVNSGGCGFVADAIVKYFNKRKIRNYKLLALFYTDDCVNDYFDEISAPNHFIIEYKYRNRQYYIDSTGIQPLEYFIGVYGDVVEEIKDMKHFRNILNNKKCWNEFFNRDNASIIYEVFK